MKKVFLCFSLLLSTGGLFAQSGFGVRGGLNLASEYIRQDNESATTKIAPSFHVGAYYDARISRGFTIQPGIFLQGKGGKSTLSNQSYTDKFLYLEVPIDFLCVLPTRKGDFFLGGGPYFAYGIDARVTNGGSAVHLNWGSQEDELRPFDLGLGTSVGYRFLNGLALRLTSSYGLLNMGNQHNTTYLNRVAGVSIGYEFKKR